MIFKKKILVLGALAIGFIHSAMSATVLQCPKSSDLSMDVKKVSSGIVLVLPTNIEDKWKIDLDDKRGTTPYQVLLAGMPETALLTISVDSVFSNQTCTYVPFTQDWSIVLTSKQPVDSSPFKQFSKFRFESLLDDAKTFVFGTQYVCRTSAGHPEDCYR